MALGRGDRLDQYEIVTLIGEGGMGEVYRALDTRIANRAVALKMSKGPFDERFQSEARSLASLTHPNICTLHDVGPNYLVMEFIEGTPLKGPLPPDKAVQYAGQVLDALDAAHRKGIIHRDLKPGNVMVTKHGIKLLDFGIAKKAPAPIGAGDVTRTAVTMNGQIIGTPQYMAPELFGGAEADARSDLWAFGCLLYELLSGRKAFPNGPLGGDPEPLTAPEPLQEVVRRCLARDPDSRYQNALDLKHDLTLAIKPQPSTAQPRRWVWAAAAATLVIGVVTGWAVTRSRSSPTSEQVVRTQIIPPEGGSMDSAGGFTLSPDGRSLAFLATASGKNGLWIRPMDGTVARLLPGTGGALFPFWSPDGRSIAYFTVGKLWRVEVGGGAPVVVAEAGMRSSGGAWGADGAMVLGGPSGLHRVPADGGVAEHLTKIDIANGETSHRWPQLLPGGRILFQVVGAPERAGIYATSLGNPREPTRLVSTDGNGVYAEGCLLWRRGTTLVAQRFNPWRLELSGEPRTIADPVGAGALSRVLADASGTLLVHGRLGGDQLGWVDREGKTLGTFGQPGNYARFRISPDGKRIAVLRGNVGTGDLWMVDVERNAWSRFTFLPGHEAFPVWSPDGKQVMFRAGQPPGLYRKEASGAGTEQRVTESSNLQWPQDWSRDGRLVLYYELAPDTQRDLWVLPVGPDGNPVPGTKARPYLRTRFNEYQVRFSPEPEPRWVAYTSDESGRDEIYVQAFPEPRGKFQISTGGGRYPEWSPDGRELYFVSPDGKLMVAVVNLGADAVTAAPPRELFPLPVGTGLQPYAVAPDGKRFLVLTPAVGSKPLEVVVNWQALLKQGANAE